MKQQTTQPKAGTETAATDGNQAGGKRDPAIRTRGGALSSRYVNASKYSIVTALSLVVGLLLWEVLGQTMRLMFLPPASDVIVRLWELIVTGQVLGELVGSLSNLAVGYAAAAVAGVAVGVAMARNAWLEEALDPYVYALLTAPTVVFVPIYFSLFALSQWAFVGLIIQYAVFIIIVNTITAIKTVDRELVEMSRVFGARNEAIIIRKVLLRAALPLISAGLRLGLGRAIKGMINAEILIAVVGIGGLSNEFGRAFDSEGMLAILVLIIIVALVLDRLAQYLDARVNAWLPSTYR